MHTVVTLGPNNNTWNNVGITGLYVEAGRAPYRSASMTGVIHVIFSDSLSGASFNLHRAYGVRLVSGITLD